MLTVFQLDAIQLQIAVCSQYRFNNNQPTTDGATSAGFKWQCIVIAISAVVVVVVVVVVSYSSLIVSPRPSVPCRTVSFQMD